MPYILKMCIFNAVQVCRLSLFIHLSATRTDGVLFFFLPNRTFMVRLGCISGEYCQAKIPKTRPNEPDMPPKRTKKLRLGIYRTQIQPNIR